MEQQTILKTKAGIIIYQSNTLTALLKSQKLIYFKYVLNFIQSI